MVATHRRRLRCEVRTVAADVGKEQWQQHTGGDSDVGQEETH